MIDWPRTEVMSQMSHSNVSLCVGRAGSAADNQEWNIIFTADTRVDMNLFYRGGNVNYPLRVVPGSGSLDFDREPRPNFKSPFLKLLSNALGMPQSSGSGIPCDITPESIFNYIYGVFYCPSYRRRYAEFLKIDFPRLPLTGILQLFSSLARLGRELVSLHLMESSKLDDHITTFVGSGDFVVDKVSYSDETAWINRAKTQGFRGVPDAVWNFRIGGYQICEKWLKDRRAKGGKNPRPGRVLTVEDIDHYEKIVVALNETIRIMDEIDKVIESHGGWTAAFRRRAVPQS